MNSDGLVWIFHLWFDSSFQSRLGFGFSVSVFAHNRNEIVTGSGYEIRTCFCNRL